MGDKKALAFIAEKTKGTRLKMTILLILCVITSFLTVFLAMLIKNVINTATDGDINGLIKYSIWTIAIVVVYFLVVIVNSYLRESIRYATEIKLKQDLFDKVLRKEYSSISAYHSGDILNRMFSDNVLVAEYSTALLPAVVSMISKLVFAFSTLIFLATEFTLVLIGCGVLIVLFSLALRKAMKKMHKQTQEADGKVRSFMQEAIENLLAVKVFSNETKTGDKAKELQADYYGKRIRQRKIYIAANSGLHFVFLLAYMLAAVYGAFGIYYGFLDFGTLTALLQLVTQVQTPLSSIGGVIPQYYNMIASAERLLEIYDLAEELETQNIEPNKFYQTFENITINDLTFAYNRDKIFENANFTINKGDFICIKGISGIGKSTLLKLVLGVYSNFEGEITFTSDNKSYPVDKGLRKLFAYVPQGNLLFSGTLKDNICFVKDNATDEEISEALKLSCADEFIKDLPDGLNTVIGENGIGLSEGQIQRIAIARALIVGAPILLLDEATSALDEKTEERLLTNLKCLKDVTLIAITHKKASESICNKVIIIDEKKIKVV